MQKREKWSSRMGFIIASVGSAVGLGNVQTFPWRLGAYGGAAFLIPYLLFAFGICWVGLISEYALGRSKQRGIISAAEKIFEEKGLKGKIGEILGIIAVIAAAGVLVFLSIITGWVVKFFVMALTGEMLSIEAATYFGSFGGTSASILWTFIALVICMGIILAGVRQGIERINKVMIPALFVMLVILIFSAIRLPGAGDGLKYLFIPDWAMLLQPITWVMALGQAFSSASLSGSSMVVYGSYLDKQEDIPNSALNIITFDTIASILVALIIFPAVFAFHLDPAEGPHLLFITLPTLIQTMPGGRLFGIMFFTALVFAAITSLLPLLEVVVEALMDRLSLDRKKSALITGIAGFVLTIPLSINFNLFGAFINLIGVYISPISAVMAAIVFFWVYGGDKALEEINRGAKRPLGAWFIPYAKYVFIGVTILIVIIGIINKGI